MLRDFLFWVYGLTGLPHTHTHTYVGVPFSVGRELRFSLGLLQTVRVAPSGGWEVLHAEEHCRGAEMVPSP